MTTDPRVAHSDPHRLAVADDLRTQLLELDEPGLYVEDAYAGRPTRPPRWSPSSAR
jgi:hypothetical protein